MDPVSVSYAKPLHEERQRAVLSTAGAGYGGRCRTGVQWAVGPSYTRKGEYDPSGTPSGNVLEQPQALGLEQPQALGLEQPQA